MESCGSLTAKSCDLIQALLKEPKIYDRVTAPIKHSERYTSVKIVRENGLIQLGKYSWNSPLGNFWNNLIKCKKDISFEEFALRVWDALVDMTAGTKAATPVLEGLGHETLMRGIREKNWDWLIDRFFDIVRHLTSDGYWKTSGLNSHTQKESPSDSNNKVVIHVKDTPQPVTPVTFKVVDCVGNVFEILNARWIGGK